MAVSAATLEALTRLGTATVYEASGRKGLIDLPLQSIVPGAAVAGPARTVSCGQGDNLMVHAAIPRVRAGDVLVVAMPEAEPVALVGDLLATQMIAHGAAGLVLNGSVRDSATLRQLGLPIWTPFVRVHGARRAVAGTIGDPIEIGGTTVCDGDLIVADDDGAVTVRAGRVAEVLEAARKRAQEEQARRARFQQGVTSFELYGLDKTWPHLATNEARDAPSSSEDEG